MIQDHTRHIGLLSISLHIPSAQSLKMKRAVLKSLKDRIRSRYNVSIADLDGQDKWQVAVLGVVMVNADNRYLDACLNDVLSFVENFHGVIICDHEIEFY